MMDEEEVMKREKRKVPPIQKTRKGQMLKHSSLKDIESARIAKPTIMNSEIDFQNVDYKKALRYLRVKGGKEYVEVGLKRIAKNHHTVK